MVGETGQPSPIWTGTSCAAPGKGTSSAVIRIGPLVLTDPSFRNRSSTDWIIIRLAEVMLNYVEAAFYLGDPNGDMADILNNEIRERAGMPALTADQITEDKIRQERQVELSFEEHVFWDLRRWRIAVQELDNKAFSKTTWIKDFDTGMYYMKREHGDKGRVRLHPERNYYYALGLGRIADNPKLVENPGYRYNSY